MSNERPESAEGLDVHEVDDGVVVYDAGRDRVHYLNASATLVFLLADGTRTLAQLQELVKEAWPADAAHVEGVDECVRRLTAEGVLR